MTAQLVASRQPTSPAAGWRSRVAVASAGTVLGNLTAAALIVGTVV